MIMTWSDDEEEFGCYNVYLCKRCDDSKPRKDFYKSWDASKKEEVAEKRGEYRPKYGMTKTKIK